MCNSLTTVCDLLRLTETLLGGMVTFLAGIPDFRGLRRLFLFVSPVGSEGVWVTLLT